MKNLLFVVFSFVIAQVGSANVGQLSQSPETDATLKILIPLITTIVVKIMDFFFERSRKKKENRKDGFVKET